MKLFASANAPLSRYWLHAKRLSVLLLALCAGQAIVSAQSVKTNRSTKDSLASESPSISDLRGEVPFLPYDNPPMTSSSKANYLSDDEPVIGLNFPEGRRAYPLRMVAWHHIINDSTGKRPLAITYCKACDSAVVFDPVVHGRTLLFSLYGFFQKSFVMIDRETEGLWYQLDGKELRGKLGKAALKMLPVERLLWGEWKARYPDTQILSSSASEFELYPPLLPANFKKPQPSRATGTLAGALVICGVLFAYLVHCRRSESGS